MGLESGTYLSDLVDTNPTATDPKAQGDDHFRLIKDVLGNTFPGADLAFYISADRADVASAASTDIGAAASQYVNITGTTTITGLGTVAAGVWRLIRFNAALTLTHNASSLILLGGANIATAAGDHALAFSRGSGNWVVLFYSRASALAVAADVSFSATGGIAATNVQTAIAEVDTEAAKKASNLSDMADAATAFTNIKQVASTSATGVAELAIAAEMVTGTDAARVPSVSVVKNHEGVAKAWGSVTNNGSAALEDSYGVSSVNRTGAGVVVVTLSVTMANAFFVVDATVNQNSGNARSIRISGRTTTTFTVETENPQTDSNSDMDFFFSVFGTLA